MLNCYGYEKENPPVAAAQNAFTTTTSTMNVNKSTEVQNGQFLKLADATCSLLNNTDINRIKGQHTKSFAISTILLISVTILGSPLIYTTIGTAYAQAPGITFPPPIFGTIRSQPAYEVSIPFSSLG